MKNNFGFSLSGRDIRWPIWGIWLSFLLFGGGIGTYSALTAADAMTPTLFDWSFVGQSAGVLGGSFLFAIAYLLLSFFVTKRSIEATSIKDAAFETDYNFRGYVWIVIKGVFFSCITFGIYIPWFATKLLRFYADGVSHRFNLMSFNGRSMTLFGITVLFAVLPSVILEGLMLTPLFVSFDTAVNVNSLAVLWLVLILIAYFLIICIYQTLYYRWLIDFSYGEKRIALKVSWWNGAWFLLGQAFLTTITLGLYAPMFWLRTLRYFTRRMVVGGDEIEEQFGMTLRPWRDWGYIWCQTLLTLITLGIYSPWAFAKISNRFVPRCYVADIEGTREAMPEA